jgi:hypothetical protein
LRPIQDVAPAVVLPSSAAIAREELLFAGLGLTLKVAGLLLAVVTLAKLALAHQQRLDRHGEIQAVLQLQHDRLQRQQRELDRLFSSDGEQAVFQQEQQWIAPNRRRIVWIPPAAAVSPVDRSTASAHEQQQPPSL